MKISKTLFSLVITMILFFTGCIYENNNSVLPETGTLSVTVKYKQDNLTPEVLALNEFDHVKFWVFDDTTKVKSVLATKLTETSSEYEGEYNFLANEWTGVNTGVEVETSVEGQLLPEDIEDFNIKNVPVGAKYLAIGIPGEGIDTKFINIEDKVVKGEVVELELGEDKNNTIVLRARPNKELTVRAVPQMMGANSVGDIYITGPFNGWNNQDAAFKMDKKENGVYEYTFSGKAPGEFTYKFGYDGNWGDADIVGDKFVDDNNGGNNSKGIVNGEASSKYLPIIALSTNKRAKGTEGVTIGEGGGANWENEGIMKLEISTNKYITDNFELENLVHEQESRNIQGSDDSTFRETVWEAKNPAIKSVQINYDGILDDKGNVMLNEKPNAFQMDNKDVDKFILIREQDDKDVTDENMNNFDDNFNYKVNDAFYLLENVDIPETAGIYQFTVTVVDKYDMVAQELVYLEVVNGKVGIKKLAHKEAYLGTVDADGKGEVEEILTVITVSPDDADGVSDIESVQIDLTEYGEGIVDFYDDGNSEVTGDAKSGDGVYTFPYTFARPMGVMDYELPVMITDKSGETVEDTVQIEVTEEILNMNEPTDIGLKSTMIKKLGAQGIPTKLIVFDGRNAEGVTSDMEIEIMGSLNGWSGGEEWKMTQVSDKVWVKLVRLEEGTYEYKVRTFGDWSNNWNMAGEKDGDNDTLEVTGVDANPSKLIIFDGRNAEGVTSDMEIEIMGSLNSWSGGEEWKMTQISDKVWIYLAHLEEGTYEYKVRTFGDWSNNWNMAGEKDGDNDTLEVTASDSNIAELFIFDGRNAQGVTSDMEIEMMGSLNSWSGGEEWKMTQVSDKVWMHLAHLEEGTYEYKVRTFGDWSNNWNMAGEKDGDNDTITITPLTSE